MKNNAKRNYYIDFLKLIFSVIIVFYHGRVFSSYPETALFNRGNFGVDFYFIVTGFLFINSLEKIKRKSREPVGLLDLKFIFKKIKDLLPAIALAYLIGYILVFYYDLLNYHTLFSNTIISEIFFLGFVGNGMYINGACWYLSVMFLVLFILYPMVYKYKKNYNYYIAPLIIFICLAITKYFNININDPQPNGLVFISGFYKGLIFINLGVIAYELSSYLKKIKINKKIRIIATILESIIYLFLILNMHYHAIGTYLFGILFTFNIALTFSNISYTSEIFNHQILQKLGEFGFVLYLTNIPIRTFITIVYSEKYRGHNFEYWLYSVLLALIIYVISEIIKKKFYKK